MHRIGWHVRFVPQPDTSVSLLEPPASHSAVVQCILMPCFAFVPMPCLALVPVPRLTQFAPPIPAEGQSLLVVEERQANACLKHETGGRPPLKLK
jgi:hypothetical protein